jgi:hypothetical protein
MIGCCIALCVLLIFLFPLVQGPFQATHGPTTEFRASRAALAVFHSMSKTAGFAVLTEASAGLPESEIWESTAPSWRNLPVIFADRSTLRC